MMFDNTTDLTCYFKLDGPKVYVACEAKLSDAHLLDKAGYSFVNGAKVGLMGIVRDSNRAPIAHFFIPAEGGTVWEPTMPLTGAEIIEIRQ